MASPTQCTWVWVSSGGWWWTGKPGMLQSMGLQRFWHDWATELNWTEYFCKSENQSCCLSSYDRQFLTNMVKWIEQKSSLCNFCFLTNDIPSLASIILPSEKGLLRYSVAELLATWHYSIQSWYLLLQPLHKTIQHKHKSYNSLSHLLYTYTPKILLVCSFLLSKLNTSKYIPDVLWLGYWHFDHILAF